MADLIWTTSGDCQYGSDLTCPFVWDGHVCDCECHPKRRTNHETEQPR